MHLGETPSRVSIPDFAHLLPTPIQAFTTGGVYSNEGDSAHRSFVQGGGHGGSHPHLAHKLVEAVLGREEPYPNAVQAANITCSGILSHQSALRGGERIYLPDWTFMPGNQPHVVALDESKQPAWAGLA